MTAVRGRAENAPRVTTVPPPVGSRRAGSKAASEGRSGGKRGPPPAAVASRQQGAAPAREPADLLDAGIARMVIQKAAGHAGGAAPDEFSRHHSGRIVITQVTPALAGARIP